jgi:GMP synthase-like glutamine amidotransferase
LGPTPCFFESHYWQLHEPPAGFVARGSTAIAPIQVIERRDRPVFGVQFHPERFDGEHPDGEVVLRNFLALSRGDYGA